MSETVKGLVGMAVLFLLGVVMICFPQVLWKMENFLTTKGGEPSDFYLVMMACGRHVIHHARHYLPHHLDFCFLTGPAFQKLYPHLNIKCPLYSAIELHPHLLDSMVYYLTDGVIYYAERNTKQEIHARIQATGSRNYARRTLECSRSNEKV